MASRGGMRAAGTDGTDYIHRERVAGHYAVSALNKGRAKWTVLFHWLLFLLMVARLSGELCKLAQLEVPGFIQQLKLPRVLVWELAWLPSIMSSMFTQLSLKRNNSTLLWQAVLGHLIMGVGPVIYGLYELYPVVPAYFKSTAVASSPDFPPQLVTGLWLAVSLQVHLFQMYFGRQLLVAWSSTKTKKSK